MTDPLKLDLGCGRAAKRRGWVNCDLAAAPNVDVSFDVQKTWPFPDESVGEVYASHLLEHVADVSAFFAELWRVMIPNGTVVLRMPYGGHGAAWWDLTHVRPWFAETFCFLQPGYGAAIGNPQHDTWTAWFGVATIDLRISGKFARLLRWRLARRLFLAFADNIQNSVEELWAHLFALKRPDDVARYRSTHAANGVAARYVVYAHQLRGAPQLPPGASDEVIALGDLDMIHGFHSWTR